MPSQTTVGILADVAEETVIYRLEVITTMEMARATFDTISPTSERCPEG